MYSITVKLPCTLEVVDQPRDFNTKWAYSRQLCATRLSQHFAIIGSTLTCRFEEAQHHWQVFTTERRFRPDLADEMTVLGDGVDTT